MSCFSRPPMRCISPLVPGKAHGRLSSSSRLYGRNFSPDSIGPGCLIKHPGPIESGEKFLPYKRDELLSRPWALPGTKGLMHRIGGLEKQDITGNVNYEPENHQHMTNTRAKKVENVATQIPLQEV